MEIKILCFPRESLEIFLREFPLEKSDLSHLKAIVPGPVACLETHPFLYQKKKKKKLDFENFEICGNKRAACKVFRKVQKKKKGAT